MRGWRCCVALFEAEQLGWLALFPEALGWLALARIGWHRLSGRFGGGEWGLGELDRLRRALGSRVRGAATVGDVSRAEHPKTLGCIE